MMDKVWNFYDGDGCCLGQIDHEEGDTEQDVLEWVNTEVDGFAVVANLEPADM